MTNTSFAIVLMGKRELVDLLCLSSWVSHDCCVGLPCGATSLSAVVIVGFPYHTHLLFLKILWKMEQLLFWI